MATGTKKRKMTAIIDEVTRKEDSKSGWGRYEVYFEGEEDLFEVDVPADANKPDTDDYIELKVGDEISLVEGAYDNWIVITGFKGDNSRSSKTTSRRGSSRGSSETTSRSSRRSSTSEPSGRSTSRRSSTSTSSKSKSDYQPSDYQAGINHKIEVQTWSNMLTNLIASGMKEDEAFDCLVGIRQAAEDFVKDHNE